MEHRSYDARGNVVADESTTPNAFTFEARKFDPTTGLQGNLTRHFMASDHRP